MENAIGWFLIAAFCAAPVWIMLWILRRNRKSEQEYRDQLERYQVELKAAQDRENERRRQQALKPSTTTVPVMAGGGGGYSGAIAGGGGSRTTTRSYTQSATALPATTSTSDDSVLRDVAMLYMMNSVWQDHNRTIDVTPAAPQIESSRDEDRVIRDTFSSSDSSSSSSDGPSSDW